MPHTWKGVRHKNFCKSTRVDSEGQKNCSSPCPTRGSNPGSSHLNSYSLTTELRPLSVGHSLASMKYFRCSVSLSWLNIYIYILCWFFFCSDNSPSAHAASRYKGWGRTFCFMHNCSLIFNYHFLPTYLPHSSFRAAQSGDNATFSVSSVFAFCSVFYKKRSCFSAIRSIWVLMFSLYWQIDFFKGKGSGS